jgi:Flp pilus assembly protein TadG
VTLRLVHRAVQRLASDRGGLALLEFAFALPVIVLLFVAGTELTHYITTKMRVSQLALAVADNAARMGTGSLLTAKTISETDINDVFIGAQLESGGLDVASNGRIILSDLEPTANPNTAGTYKVGWQRCYGAKTLHTSTYGTTGQTNMPGMGPAGRLVTAQEGNATMFVEVYYVYKPIIDLTWVPNVNMNEIASMAVREQRDLSTGPTNSEGAPVANC